MKHYYNEFDPKIAAWLVELIRAGHIPDGHVDTRSIADVHPNDLSGYTQCHFFAGIAGWSLALRLAGWPDDRPVWTGSCPCQPFSAAGRQRGTGDERHLWPEFHRLIRECRPPAVFGEQVASRLGREWLAGVFADMEGVGYAVAGADLCAAGIAAPHIRQRLFWVAHSEGRGQRVDGCPPGSTRHADERGPAGGLAHSGGARPQGDLSGPRGTGPQAEPGEQVEQLERHGDAGGLADARRSERGEGPSEGREVGERNGLLREPEGAGRAAHGGGLVYPLGAGLEGQPGHGDDGHQPGRLGPEPAGSASEAGDPGAVAHPGGLVGQCGEHLPERGQEGRDAHRRAGPWSDYRLIPCADGKTRRIESSLEPLAPSVPSRVVRLRGYGNAIVAPLAARFIRATGLLCVTL